MKKVLRLPHYLLVGALLVFAISCDNDDDDNGGMDNDATAGTIVEEASATDDLSSLVAALAKADENEDSDLIGTLSGEGPFTVFAPTNDAFADLLASLDGFDSLDDFDTEEEKALLGSILEYHVVAGLAAASTDLSDGQEIPTVQGENLTISLEGGVFIEDATDEDAEVILPDVLASNGIVHIIDKVLLPEAIVLALNDEESNTLVDIVVETESLSQLEAAVIKADLVETLSSEGPFTVFAPTDDAFMGLLMALGEDYSSLEDFDTDEEIALLRDILLYHVIPAEVLAADLAAGEVGTALTDNSIEIIESGDTFVIGDASDTNANILETDIEATNGVAHVIDKVLLPQSAVDFVASLQMMNIVEIAIATDDLSILVDALVLADQQANAGLVDTLSGEGHFTVFAPTNQAFVDLLDALGDDYNSLADFDTQEEVDLLVSILTYHVVAGTEAFSTDLSNGQHIPTVNGANVGINLSNGGVHIVDATHENATVVIPDVDASNGVVHVIDKVLLPQEAVDFVASLQMMDIVELAQSVDDLSILVEALVQADAGLVEALSGEGSFTVFAPNNHAFQQLFHLLGPSYHSIADFDTPQEKELLASVLLYHVVDGIFTSEDFDGHQRIKTLQGEEIAVDVRLNGQIKILDKTHERTNINAADNEASNGIVHIVDKVLLPQEVLDMLH